ncbi:MAG: M28 family peptidase [Myxococcota bacterium]|jgi:hypothetical protein|nr:M28 family peptidase [Myxococcota bacterium]
MNEAAHLQQQIFRIESLCPQRAPSSEGERRAQEVVAAEFAALGLPTTWQPFTFNDSLHANLALHFGLGTLGTLVGGVSPAAGLLLHGACATSYQLEVTRRHFLLRRLLPPRRSQNLLVTLPAKESEPRLRIVFLAHADAAITGFIFDPRVTRLLHRDLPGPLARLRRPLELAVRTQQALAVCDLLRLLGGPLAWPLRPLEWALTLPSLLVFLGSLQALLADELVPGANDDLSGLVALPVLARRLAADQPPDVELVFVATGCEEPGFGGADALVRETSGRWDRTNTVVIALDSIGGGDLRWLDVEGDLPLPLPAWLRLTLQATAAADERFAGTQGFAVPCGGTDMVPFRCAGYAGVGLIGLDPTLGTPTHYHLPTDTSDNLDYEKLLLAVDFAEQLARRLYRGIPALA